MGVDFIGNLLELQPGEFFTFSPNDRSVGGRCQERMDILRRARKGQTSESGVTRVWLGREGLCLAGCWGPSRRLSKLMPGCACFSSLL